MSCFFLLAGHNQKTPVLSEKFHGGRVKKLNVFVTFTVLLFSFSAVTEEGIEMPNDQELIKFIEANPKYQKEYLRINKMYLKERLKNIQLQKQIATLKDEVSILQEDFQNSEREVEDMDKQLTEVDDRYEKLYEEYKKTAGREPAEELIP